jgi:KUP system potassium uptake protein
VHNLRYNKMLHEHVVVLTVATVPTPYVAPGERVTVTAMGANIYNARIQYGFMEDPDVPEVLVHLRAAGVPIDEDDVTFFLGRETIVVGRRQGMATWREKLFVLMARNAVRATAFFKLPPERVVELGVQVEL